MEVLRLGECLQIKKHQEVQETIKKLKGDQKFEVVSPIDKRS